MTSAPHRIIFMGTPDFSVPALDALARSAHDIVAVYTQPPRPAERGHRERPSPVHRRANDLGLPVLTPVNFRGEADRATFAGHDADLAVVIAYGLILPRALLDMPKRGAVNLHASLLPRWRGAAPIQRAILAGDTKTGVTLMQMEAGLDTGPMLATRETPIHADETGHSLHDRLAALAAELLSDTLHGLLAGTLRATPQPDAGVTYAEKLTRADGRLDWHRPARDLDRQTRGLFPWPGAWFEHGGERIKVLRATPVALHDGGNALSGTILSDDATIKCGEGALRLTTVQRPGRKPVDGADFLRGLRLSPGQRIGCADHTP